MKLMSSDGKTFEIPETCARLSVTITNLREDIGEDEVIPLPNTQATTLSRVVEWMLYHKNDNPIDKDAKKIYRTDDIDPWDKQFASGGDKDELFALMMAANYLDIQPLLDLCCKVVAISLKGLKPEQIAKELGDAVIDWSPEEELRVRQENPWLDEI